jgi:hypothetical protein
LLLPLEDPDDIDLNLPNDSSPPVPDSFAPSGPPPHEEPWMWESINYPSVIGVLNLSGQFPLVAMSLNYEREDGFLSGEIYIKNGSIVNEEDYVACAG